MTARAYLAGVLWLAVLGGCATLTFKRGASPGDMAADEQACRAANPGGEGPYVECMRERGWFVAEPDAAPNAVPDAAPAPTAVTAPAEPEAAAPRGAPSAAADDRATPPVPAAALTPPAAAPSTTPTGAGKAAAPPAARAPSGTDPLARVEVGSWWKLGGNAADLDRAIDACVATLGPAHRPDPGALVVTEGLRSCLRASGWYSLKGAPGR